MLLTGVFGRIRTHLAPRALIALEGNPDRKGKSEGNPRSKAVTNSPSTPCGILVVIEGHPAPVRILVPRAPVSYTLEDLIDS